MASRERVTIVLSVEEREDLLVWIDYANRRVIAPMSEATNMAVHRIRTARIASWGRTYRERPATTKAGRG